MAADLRVISPDATPEEVAAIVAAVGALRVGRGGRIPLPTTRCTNGCARRGSSRTGRVCSAVHGGSPAASGAAPESDLVTDRDGANHAELMSVGTSEVVVTFTSEPDVASSHASATERSRRPGPTTWRASTG